MRCNSATAWLALLPADDAKHVRKELGDLGVRVIRLATLPDQMVYDKERLAVQAGKPVEIVFENNDLMPHNFVIVQPGSMEEVGMLGETTGLQPDAFKRQFVPRSNKVIFASRLLQPREQQRLSFTAPTKPGVYPYVCTFPGHWRRMYGALYVVEDLDDYQADPEAYLAKHPLPIARRAVEIQPPAHGMEVRRSASAGRDISIMAAIIANGKQMFTVASCIACHRLNNVGTQVGADLTKIDPKWKPVDVLQKILEPSSHINEKFHTYILSLDSGKTVTGPDHRRNRRRGQADGESAGEVRADDAEEIEHRESEEIERRRSCRRACWTSSPRRNSRPRGLRLLPTAIRTTSCFKAATKRHKPPTID